MSGKVRAQGDGPLLGPKPTAAIRSKRQCVPKATPFKEHWDRLMRRLI